jgi:hypothetical protein
MPQHPAEAQTGPLTEQTPLTHGLARGGFSTTGVPACPPGGAQRSRANESASCPYEYDGASVCARATTYSSENVWWRATRDSTGTACPTSLIAARGGIAQQGGSGRRQHVLVCRKLQHPSFPLQKLAKIRMADRDHPPNSLI